MFTGIVRGMCKVDTVQKKPGLLQYAITLPNDLLEGLKLGASVSIAGTCQTVVKIENNNVWFDAIQETLDRTTLKTLKPNQYVNVERSARFGDEIGGHLLSGHIWGTAKIKNIQHKDNNCIMTFQVDPEWIKYFFPKGFIALDGVSLTLTDVHDDGTFTVHFIPETLRLTTFGSKGVGDLVNVELDSQTQTIVTTIERIESKKI